MPALARADGDRLLRFLAEAGALGRREPFTGEVLVELGKLVPSDRVSYTEQDRVRRRLISYVQREGDPSDETGAGPACFIDYGEHPIALYRQRGLFDARKLSDFVSLREFRRTKLYETWFRPMEINRELTVQLPSPVWHLRGFIFDRERRDFSERDRLIVNYLQPHLANLWRTARTRRRLAAALDGLRRASERETLGVILVGSDGRAEFISPPARRLLRTYFPERTNGRLPPLLSEWTTSESAPPLSIRRSDRRLVIERSGDGLLLQETRDGGTLTAREEQVLALVASGKTNGEIAQILWLSPATVRKHLENIYARLGVRTRTAAVAAFLGLIEDAEESSPSMSSAT